MSEFKVRSGALKLKGEEDLLAKKAKKKAKKEKKKAKKRKLDEKPDVFQLDETVHGGWYKYINFEEMKPGLTGIEFGDRAYVFSLDNGLFTLGEPRKDDGMPQPEEQYFLSKISDTKISLKSGYGKFLGVDKSGIVTGRVEAITPLEQFEPVWQEVEGIRKCAILAANGCFIGFNEEGDLVAKSQVAGEDNFLSLRTNIPKIEENLIPIEERGTERETEEAIARKYQHWQDMRMKLSKDDISNVKRAREEGRLHTELLDRRAGMKSDKYCK